MRYILLLNLLLILYLAISCAQQTSPTGGPQDTIPPKLIQSIPANKTTNFKGKSIELTFDEDVTINNPREQLLITPSIGNKVEMEARKKNIILNLNADLKDSTTYTINFRESIQDVTEKNPVENLQLAFSTGSYLDSLSIKGNIYDLLSGKEVKDGTAALYIESDTFDIFKHKPIYLTKSDDNGYFEFNNLKPDTYHIYAFDDKNKNLVVDSKTEHYGFISQSIDLKADSTFYFRIPIIPLDARELKLISAKPYNTYFNIRLSKNLSEYQISPVLTQDSTKLEHIFGEDQASIHVFFSTESLDSIPIEFNARDTIGNRIDTVLYAKINTRKSQPEKFIMSIEYSTFHAEKNLLEANIKFNKPIRSINLDSIDYQIDSTHLILFEPSDLIWNNQTSQLKLSKQISKEKMPQTETDQSGNEKIPITERTQKETKTSINKLRLKKSFFITIDNDTSQRIEQSVNELTQENTGTILVEINTQEKNFIVQILGQEGKVHQTFYNIANPAFKNLPPANYQIRLIIDQNANKKWDSGNFYKKEQPEPILYYLSESDEQAINIKANWELGPLLISYP